MTITLPDVPITPWVGKQYEFSPERLLVLGESHYDSTGKYLEPGAAKNYTIETWNEYLDAPTGRFWTNIVQVMEGKPIAECDNIRAAVENIAFYNYCNSMVATTARVAPSSTAWQESKPDFYRVLDAIQPKHILVLGQRLWSNLKEDQCGEKVSFGKKSRNVCYFKAAGRLVPSLPINHPSSAFSWQESRPWVEELLKRGYGAD